MTETVVAMKLPVDESLRIQKNRIMPAHPTGNEKRIAVVTGTHGDELEAMGLGVPAMTRVFHRLRAMGVDIDPSVYTTEQARDAVLAKLARAGQQKQSASGERGAV